MDCDCPNPKFCKCKYAKPNKPKSGLKRSPLRSNKPLKQKVPMRKKSKSQEEKLAIYNDLKKVYMKKNPTCVIGVSGCTHKATEVHHKGYRGRNLNKIETWAASCSNCHAWVHSHPNEARAIGWLL